MRALLRLVYYLRQYRLRVLVGYLCLTGSTLLGFVVPWALKEAIDLGLSGDEPDISALATMALVVAGIGVVKGLFSFGQRYLTEWLGHRVAYDLRNHLYDHIQRLSFSYHDYAQIGQLMSRCTSDVLSVQRFAGIALMEVVNVALLLVGIVTILFLISPSLAPVALLPIPILAAITIRFGTIIRPRFKAIQEAFAAMTTVLQESLVGVQVVKAFAREPYETDRFSLKSWDVREQRLRTIEIFGVNFPLMFFVIGLSTPLILWFGGRQVVDGTLTVGTLVAFQAYVALLAMPVQRLGFLVNMTAEAMASAERIFEILDAEADIRDAPDALPLAQVEGIVCFENVSFGYQRPTSRPPSSTSASSEENGKGDEERPVLHNVDLVARPGEVVALLGHTGSGKSTIIRLIPRFYDVTEGCITVDGHDIRDVTLESLRGRIGMVLQDTILFSATIQENIAYGRPDARDDEIVAAAKAARAHDFITEFPDGYETLVGERGVTLSGGQRQRVAIARALLLDPRILILDDSTSSVDTETEYQIQQALAELMKGRTTFVIAQRLQTVTQADQILILDQGRIVEQGTHETLLAQGGLYKEIYDLQLRDQERLRRELAVLGGDSMEAGR